jgi:hypothetical protein
MRWKQHEEPPKFKVTCQAGEVGQFSIASGNVKLEIAQRVRLDGKAQLWDSLRVECHEQDDGSLGIEIVISHPNWEKPLRIAYAESAPQDTRSEEPTLGFDLEQLPL